MIDSKEKYNKLFDTVEKKAQAFDMIAEKYYFSNFGMTSKADVDVLMFSLYIEQILSQGNVDFTEYSDYTLSKLLGITQSRVSNLKVKKELQYPYVNFDWKKSFLKICEKATYSDGKIKLNIPDKNLFLEIQNAIEEKGGFVEIQLNSKLLQVKLAYFLDLFLLVDDSVDRKEILRKIKQEKNDSDEKYVEGKTFSEILEGVTGDLFCSIISYCVPLFGDAIRPFVQKAVSKICETIKRSNNKKG